MVDCKKDVRRSLPTKPGVLQCPRKFPQVKKFNRACKVSNFLPWYCVKKLGKKQQQFFSRLLYYDSNPIYQRKPQQKRCLICFHYLPKSSEKCCVKMNFLKSNK